MSFNVGMHGDVVEGEEGEEGAATRLAQVTKVNFLLPLAGLLYRAISTLSERKGNWDVDPVAVQRDELRKSWMPSAAGRGDLIDAAVSLFLLLLLHLLSKQAFPNLISNLMALKVLALKVLRNQLPANLQFAARSFLAKVLSSKST